MECRYVKYRVASAAPKTPKFAHVERNRVVVDNALEIRNGGRAGRQGSPYSPAYRSSGQDQRRLHRNRPREAPVGQGRRSLHVAREPERLHLGGAPDDRLASNFGVQGEHAMSVSNARRCFTRTYQKGTIFSDLPRHLTRGSASSRRLRRVSKHAAFGCPEDGNYRLGGGLSAKN